MPCQLLQHRHDAQALHLWGRFYQLSASSASIATKRLHTFSSVVSSSSTSTRIAKQVCFQAGVTLAILAV